MAGKAISIPTKDGVAGGKFFEPTGGKDGGGPGVILFMDAFGVRAGLEGMAERLAGEGFGVLLPNLYYRAGAIEPIEPGKAFNDPKERERLTPLFSSLTVAVMREDTAAYLAFLEKESSTEGRKVGCVGYCMGGAFALAAAAYFPERVGAAASFHGARLATDKPDSPHMLASKMRAEIYIGVAGIDPHFTEEERGRIRGALEACGVRNKVEVYEGVKHGFAVIDVPAYDQAASERHFAATVDLFKRNLR